MRVVGLIPARFGSSRFPGKPLALIAGKPLLQRVIEQCQKSSRLAEVIVATDDARIAHLAKKFCRVELTSPDHASGTDRIAEAAERTPCDAAVNIQGDEPLIDPALIDAVAQSLESARMATAAAPLLRPEEFDNPNVVKVVLNASGQALYFSRRTIPFLRGFEEAPAGEQLREFPFLKHLGIYGYQIEALRQFVRAAPGKLEQAEKLEQLRALELGIPIQVIQTRRESIGVDTPEDLARVEKILATA